jgi:hypothetical protein
MAKPTLQDLPMELINFLTPHLIASNRPTYPAYTNLTPFYGLRLTSRALYQKTLVDFGNLAFSTLTVDFTLAGLDRFYEISQNAELRMFVRCIIFAHDYPVYLGMMDVRETGSETLEDIVMGRLKEGFKRILTGLPNLRRIVIATPFAAIYTCYWEKERSLETTTAGDQQLHQQQKEQEKSQVC